VLSEADICKLQEDDISRISTVLSISRNSSAILLRHYNWCDSRFCYSDITAIVCVCVCVCVCLEELFICVNVFRCVSRVHDEWFADEEKVRDAVGLLEKPVVDFPTDGEVCLPLFIFSFRLTL